jgi:hypothetical protein
MTAQAQITAAGDMLASIPALAIRDTSWGFVATPRTEGLSREVVTEAALKFLAITMLAGASAQWLLPGAIFAGDVVVMKLVLTALLGGLAALLFRFADQGFLPELQVDAALREIRLGARNAHGATRVANRIPMREIEEVFVRAAAREPGVTELCFRVAGHADPVRIAAGSVADLAPILERLARDLRTPRERVALRMAG